MQTDVNTTVSSAIKTNPIFTTHPLGLLLRQLRWQSQETPNSAKTQARARDSVSGRARARAGPRDVLLSCLRERYRHASVSLTLLFLRLVAARLAATASLERHLQTCGARRAWLLIKRRAPRRTAAGERDLGSRRSTTLSPVGAASASWDSRARTPRALPAARGLQRVEGSLYKFNLFVDKCYLVDKSYCKKSVRSGF